MNHRLSGFLAPSVHGCAHFRRVQLARPHHRPEQVQPGARRRFRLRALYVRAGGRPDEIRRRAGRSAPDDDGRARHCP